MQQHERASQQPAWYDEQPFDIGVRVQILDAAEQQAAGGVAGRVVGYDASGPRAGEEYIRVLVLVDKTPPEIAAVAPAALQAEQEPEHAQVALTMLRDLEQSLGAASFAKLRAWLQSEQCAKLLDDPHLARQNIRLGRLVLPGFLLPDLVRLSRQ